MSVTTQKIQMAQFSTHKKINLKKLNKYSFQLIEQVMPYQGSKRKIANEILSFFPSKLNHLIEPFAGSAAISIHALVNTEIKSVWINDSNTPLIDLWKEILENPKVLSSKYSRLWYKQLGSEHEFYNKIRDKFNQKHDPADFLYLLARCVKAAVRYNNDGNFNNSCDNRRVGAKPDEMKRRIMTAHKILHKKCHLTSFDYKKIFEQCTRNDLLYMDPPYQGTCGGSSKRYKGMFSHEEFCEQLSILNDKKIPFILSYDGKTGKKIHGKTMPKHLQLKQIIINAGRSTQSTLLGKKINTMESLYLSPYL